MYADLLAYVLVAESQKASQEPREQPCKQASDTKLNAHTKKERPCKADSGQKKQGRAGGKEPERKEARKAIAKQLHLKASSQARVPACLLVALVHVFPELIVLPLLEFEVVCVFGVLCRDLLG